MQLRLTIAAMSLFLACATVRACPMCSEAVPSTTGSEYDDQTRESLAYNDSIYLMAGMPYLLMAGGSMWVYRGLRRKALFDQMLIASIDGAGTPAVADNMPPVAADDAGPTATALP